MPDAMNGKVNTAEENIDEVINKLDKMINNKIDETTSVLNSTTSSYIENGYLYLVTTTVTKVKLTK